MRNRFCKNLLLSALLAFSLPSLSEDIDLFVTGSPVTQNELPNVLFVVDNTANWGSGANPQPFTNEKAALVNTFTSLSTDKFRVGVLFANETGNPNNNVTGGYVRAAIRTMDAANKAKYAAMFQNLDSNADKGNGGALGLVMAEAYRYFSAGAPYAGNGKVKTDYTGNDCSECSNLDATQKAANSAVYALAGNALSSKNATVYNSPISAGCQKNYIIYISNGPNQENTSNLTKGKELLNLAKGLPTSTSITQFSLSPSGSQENLSDEWAYFMKESSLGVVTFTIDVNPGTTGQGPGWTALMKSIANVSGGQYFSVSSSSGAAGIEAAINAALSEILAVNSVFAAVSLPVSVNTQGTYLNQVFIGMFRPDANADPRWNGNLKQYRLGFDSDNILRLQDAGGFPAISTSTGFVDKCARSYWTPTSVDSYWAFAPQGQCTPSDLASDPRNIVLDSSVTSDSLKASNYPDGNIVEKGAQAYKLRSTTSRTVYTCSPVFATCAATATLTSFASTNNEITDGLLGLPSTVVPAATRETLIDWARGLDMRGEEDNDSISNEMRPSAHGDVLHSRPVAINYGTETAPSVVVYYGGNDGMLRAVNGNRNAPIGSVAPGNELWSFVAPESYTLFKRIFDNSPQVKTATIPTGTPKPYGFDGPMAAYKGDSGEVWLYATMRRGGRALYAFDVSAPAAPTLKWKVGCPNNFPTSGTVSDADCSTGFSGIGQTWSSPKFFKASGYGSGASPLLIVGGGYDPCEDSDPNSCSATGYSQKGNHIYVVDANTGALLKTFDTDRGVVADVAVIPDSSGMAQYAYTADLGGNVYRIAIGSAAPASWTITKIASLGCDTTASCAANRKFMFAPDVVEESGTYILLVGSGDREKPLRGDYYPNAYGVSNYFFMVKDKPADSTWLSSESANCETQSIICLNSLYGILTADTPAQSLIDEKKGWYLGMAGHEQVVTSAITLFGTVTFSTHIPVVPVAGSCGSDLGTANVYNISYLNAASTITGASGRFEEITGGGLSPSPVAGFVTIYPSSDDPLDYDGTSENSTPVGTQVPFCIGCGKESLEGGEKTGGTSASLSQPKSRVYWYIQQ